MYKMLEFNTAAPTRQIEPQMTKLIKRTSLRKTINQDMRIVFNHIKIDGMIIERMSVMMIIKRKMIAKKTTEGTIITNMSVITHLAMIEMIHIRTKAQDIRMTDDITTNGGMMTIDKLIVDSEQVTNGSQWDDQTYLRYLHEGWSPCKSMSNKGSG